MKVSIVIPALNEEEKIGEVLDLIPFGRLPETEVIVVDNGSWDRTAQVASSKGARVVTEPKKGYGIATLTGLSHATGDVVVTMDADGAHWPGDLPRLLDPILTGASKATLGVRIHSYPHGMKIRRFLGNVVLARIFDTLYGEHLSDVQCGFRAIHRKVLERIRLSQKGMQLTTELLIQLKQKRVPFKPVEVKQLPSQRSHVREVRDFMGHIVLMLRGFPKFLAAGNESA